MGRHTIQCFIGRRAKPDVVKSILDDVPNLAKLLKLTDSLAECARKHQKYGFC